MIKILIIFVLINLIKSDINCVNKPLIAQQKFSEYYFNHKDITNINGYHTTTKMISQTLYNLVKTELKHQKPPPNNIIDTTLQQRRKEAYTDIAAHHVNPNYIRYNNKLYSHNDCLKFGKHKDMCYFNYTGNVFDYVFDGIMYISYFASEIPLLDLTQEKILKMCTKEYSFIEGLMTELYRKGNINFNNQNLINHIQNLIPKTLNDYINFKTIQTDIPQLWCMSAFSYYSAKGIFSLQLTKSFKQDANKLLHQLLENEYFLSLIAGEENDIFYNYKHYAIGILKSLAFVSFGIDTLIQEIDKIMNNIELYCLSKQPNKQKCLYNTYYIGALNSAIVELLYHNENRINKLILYKKYLFKLVNNYKEILKQSGFITEELYNDFTFYNQKLGESMTQFPYYDLGISKPMCYYPNTLIDIYNSIPSKHLLKLQLFDCYKSMENVQGIKINGLNLDQIYFNTAAPNQGNYTIVINSIKLNFHLKSYYNKDIMKGLMKVLSNAIKSFHKLMNVGSMQGEMEIYGILMKGFQHNLFLGKPGILGIYIPSTKEFTVYNIEIDKDGKVKISDLGTLVHEVAHSFHDIFVKFMFLKAGPVFEGLATFFTSMCLYGSKGIIEILNYCLNYDFKQFDFKRLLFNKASMESRTNISPLEYVRDFYNLPAIMYNYIYNCHNAQYYLMIESLKIDTFKTFMYDFFTPTIHNGFVEYIERLIAKYTSDMKWFEETNIKYDSSTIYQLGNMPSNMFGLNITELIC